MKRRSGRASVYFQRDYVRRHMRGGLTLNPMISDKVFSVTINALEKDKILWNLNSSNAILAVALGCG